MSEQDGSVQESTPAVAGPEGTPGTAEQTPPYGDPSDPYEKRYNDLRSWTDRVSTESAQQREQMAMLQERQELYDLLLSTDDPDTRRQVAEALGYELEQEEAPEFDEDDENPFVAYDERIGRLEQSLSERDQEQQDEAYAEEVRAIVDEQLAELNIDEDDQDWVLAYAINALPITEEGLPDIAQAFQVFQARETERQKRWAQTKRAPHFNPHGQPGTEAPNLDDRQQRQDFILRRMAEGEQAAY